MNSSEEKTGEPESVTAPKHLVLPIALTAGIAVCSVCSYIFLDDFRNDLINVIYLGTTLSLACAAGIWLGISNRWWRFLLAPFVITAIACYLAFSLSSGFDIVSAVIPGLTTLIVFAALEITKLFFGSFRRIRSDEPVLEGLQFRISHLMITTTAFAIFISALQFMLGDVRFSSQSFTVEIIFLVTILVATLVLFTLTTTWALMGKKVFAKLVACLVLSAVSIAYTCLNSPDPTFDGILVWAGMLLICWFTILALIWLLRMEGVRFIKRA